MRVLLVDDEEDRAATVSAGLTAAGCTVVAVAPDATQLTRRVRESGADVIVCALDDPSRDALESMGALHRDEPRPVVVFAARGDTDQIQAVGRNISCTRKSISTPNTSSCRLWLSAMMST